MKKPVLWNQTGCYAKRLGFVCVFVALLCMVLVDLFEGNPLIHKEISSGNVADWRSQSIDENAPTLHYQKEFEQNNIATEDFNVPCEKEKRQENLSNSHHCNDYQTTVLRKLHEHLQQKACPHPPSSGHTHGPTSSPSTIKRAPIRALLTSPDNLENSYTRHSRKLADIGSIVNGDGPLLLGVIVTTMVVTLGLFALFLFCCLGRDALKPPVKESQSQPEEEDKLVVNLRSKDYKNKLGALQRSMRSVFSCIKQIETRVG